MNLVKHVQMDNTIIVCHVRKIKSYRMENVKILLMMHIIMITGYDKNMILTPKEPVLSKIQPLIRTTLIHH